MNYHYGQIQNDSKDQYLVDILDNYSSVDYIQYRESVKLYIEEFSTKLHESCPNLNNPKKATETIFVNFFLSGDNFINIIAKQLGMKGILDS